jgi:hypothetical protein
VNELRRIARRCSGRGQVRKRWSGAGRLAALPAVRRTGAPGKPLEVCENEKLRKATTGHGHSRPACRLYDDAPQHAPHRPGHATCQKFRDTILYGILGDTHIQECSHIQCARHKRTSTTQDEVTPSCMPCAYQPRAALSGRAGPLRPNALVMGVKQAAIQNTTNSGKASRIPPDKRYVHATLVVAGVRSRACVTGAAGAPLRRSPPRWAPAGDTLKAMGDALGLLPGHRLTEL